jgi:hypothetical protein
LQSITALHIERPLKATPEHNFSCIAIRTELVSGGHRWVFALMTLQLGRGVIAPGFASRRTFCNGHILRIRNAWSNTPLVSCPSCRMHRTCPVSDIVAYCPGHFTDARCCREAGHQVWSRRYGLTSNCPSGQTCPSSPCGGCG